jgi:hypothetical protein
LICMGTGEALPKDGNHHDVRCLLRSVIAAAAREMAARGSKQGLTTLALLSCSVANIETFLRREVTAMSQLDSGSSLRFTVAFRRGLDPNAPLAQWEGPCRSSISAVESRPKSIHVGFEVFTALTMKNGVFWGVIPCGSCKNRRFGGT